MVWATGARAAARILRNTISEFATALRLRRNCALRAQKASTTGGFAAREKQPVRPAASPPTARFSQNDRRLRRPAGFSQNDRRLLRPPDSFCQNDRRQAARADFKFSNAPGARARDIQIFFSKIFCAHAQRHAGTQSTGQPQKDFTFQLSKSR